MRRPSRFLLRVSAALSLWSAGLFAADPAGNTPELQSAIAEYRARHDAEARAALEKIRADDPASDIAYFYLGKLAKRRKDWLEAIAQWKKCTELKPNEAEYWGVLAEAYAQRMNQNKVSYFRYRKPVRAALEKAIELAPDDLRFRRGYIILLVKTPGFLGGSMDDARLQAEEIKKRDPAAGWLVLGQIESEAKNWAAAETALLEAAKLSPDSVEPAIALARLLIERDRSEDALKRFDELLTQNPKHPGAQVYFAKAALACDRELERGEAALREFLKLSSPPPQLPSAAEAQAMLGEFLWRRGDKNGAREAYEAALKMDPDQSVASAGLKRLKAD